MIVPIIGQYINDFCISVVSVWSLTLSCMNYDFFFHSAFLFIFMGVKQGLQNTDTFSLN